MKNSTGIGQARDACPPEQYPQAVDAMHVRAYLQLMRLPAVFTAMADICLGFLLVQGFLAPPLAFGLLLGASSCLYLAGMVFNDVFDRHVDARERPQRPIPSGRVAAGRAVLLGTLLLAAGIGSAAAIGGQSLLVAVMLALAVLAYDAALKATFLGPVAMGACRFLNVMLGASLADHLWQPPQTIVAAAMGTYIVGVTWFARHEAGQSGRGQLAGAAAVINLGLAAVLALLVAAPWGPAEDTMPTLLIFAVIFLTINRRITRALADPSPAAVQAGVRIMLLSVVTLDATLILAATGEAVYAIGTAALLLPAIVIGRWLYVT